MGPGMVRPTARDATRRSNVTYSSRWEARSLEVPLCGLTSGLAEFTNERLLDIGEAEQIGLVELDLEVVGNNGLPFHTDRAGIGHLAHETVPNFHRSHAAAEETSDGAVDQPFESSFD